jgi:uncharacterized protein
MMLVDLFEFARHGQTARGELPLGALARVDSLARTGTLAWTAVGSMNGRHGAPRLDLTVNGDIPMLCQRCLQPLDVPVRIATRFLIAQNDAEAEALDQDDDFDVVVGSAAFDLDGLVEDEVILALPSAPRHAVCPTGTAQGIGTTAGKPSPFAVLAGLKRKSDGGDGQDND